MDKKKKIIIVSGLLLFLTAVIGLLFYSRYTYKPVSLVPVEKKKIIIFSSVGGGGHIAASRALTSVLGDNYTVKVVETFSEVLKTAEPISVLTGERYKAVDLYNYFLSLNCYRFANLFQFFGKWYSNLRSEKVVEILSNYLQEEQPDLVLSVIPTMNSMILRAAKELNIPFFLIPTDFGYGTYMYNLSGQSEVYDQFYLATTFAVNDIPGLKKKLDIPIQENNIIYSKIPIRSEFFALKDRAEIKKRYSIPEDKPVVFVMMGGQGSRQLCVLARLMKKISVPAHIIFCLGRCKELAQKFSKIYFPHHLTVTTFGFTDKIADLMAISDVLITKPGPNTIAEAMQMDLPMILDVSSSQLHWEKPNVELVKQCNVGHVADSLNDVILATEECLKYPKKLETFRLNLSALPKINGALAVKKVIDDILIAHTD